MPPTIHLDPDQTTGPGRPRRATSQSADCHHATGIESRATTAFSPGWSSRDRPQLRRSSPGPPRRRDRVQGLHVGLTGPGSSPRRSRRAGWPTLGCSAPERPLCARPPPAGPLSVGRHPSGIPAASADIQHLPVGDLPPPNSGAFAAVRGLLPLSRPAPRAVVGRVALDYPVAGSNPANRIPSRSRNRRRSRSRGSGARIRVGIGVAVGIVVGVGVAAIVSGYGAIADVGNRDGEADVSRSSDRLCGGAAHFKSRLVCCAGSLV